nr:MAG TPA: hypothetical protein [Caudoviricetes sp.]
MDVLHCDRGKYTPCDAVIGITSKFHLYKAD